MNDESTRPTSLRLDAITRGKIAELISYFARETPVAPTMIDIVRGAIAHYHAFVFSRLAPETERRSADDGLTAYERARADLGPPVDLAALRARLEARIAAGRMRAPELSERLPKGFPATAAVMYCPDCGEIDDGKKQHMWPHCTPIVPGKRK